MLLVPCAFSDSSRLFARVGDEQIVVAGAALWTWRSLARVDFVAGPVNHELWTRGSFQNLRTYDWGESGVWA